MEFLEKMASKFKDLKEKKEKELSTELDDRAKMGIASVSNVERLAFEEEDAASINERGVGLVGTERVRTLADYEREIELINDPDAKGEFYLEMTRSDKNEIVDFAIKNLSIILLNPKTTSEFRLWALDEMRSLRGDKFANTLCQSIIKSNGINFYDRFKVGLALLANNETIGGRVLDGMLEGFPFGEDKFTLFSSVEDAIEESQNPLIKKWALQLATKIFASGDIHYEEMSDYLDSILALGGDEAWEDAICLLGENEKAGLFCRVDFLFDLANFSPSKALPGLKRIAGNFLIAPPEDQNLIFEVIERMGKIQDSKFLEFAFEQAEKIVTAKKTPSLNFRIRGIDLINGIKGSELALKTASSAIKSREMPPDQLLKIAEKMIGMGGIKNLKEALNRKPFSKEGINIVSSLIAPMDTESQKWAADFLLNIANSGSRLVQVEALAALALMNNGYRRQNYLDRLYVLARPDSNEPANIALEAAKKIDSINGNTQALTARLRTSKGNWETWS